MIDVDSCWAFLAVSSPWREFCPFYVIEARAIKLLLRMSFLLESGKSERFPSLHLLGTLLNPLGFGYESLGAVGRRN